MAVGAGSQETQEELLAPLGLEGQEEGRVVSAPRTAAAVDLGCPLGAAAGGEHSGARTEARPPHLLLWLLSPPLA